MMILRYFAELCIVFPAMIMAVMPLHRRAKRRLLLIAGIGIPVLLAFCTSGAVVCTRLGCSSGLVLFPAMLLLFILYHLSFDAPLSKQLFCYLNATMLSAFVTNFSVIFTSPWELYNHDTPQLLQSSLFCLLVSVLVILLFHWTLLKKIPDLLRNSCLDKLWWTITLVPAAVAVLLVWATPVNPEVMVAGRVRIIGIWLMLMLLIAALALYQILWLVANQITQNAELVQENEMLQMEQKRYEELRRYIRRTRTLRHDFRQHIIAIQHYLEIGDTKALGDYLEQFDAVIHAPNTTYCTNGTMDAVIAHYVQLAEQQAARLELSLYFPEELPVSESDLCVILGNLLENAIHAVSTVPEEQRVIRLRAKLLTAETIGISISNPYSGTITLNKNGIPTSDKPQHGIGLHSVLNIVHKLHGNLQIRTENGVFKVSLTI